MIPVLTALSLHSPVIPLTRVELARGEYLSVTAAAYVLLEAGAIIWLQLHQAVLSMIYPSPCKLPLVCSWLYCLWLISMASHELGVLRPQLVCLSPTTSYIISLPVLEALLYWMRNGSDYPYWYTLMLLREIST